MLSPSTRRRTLGSDIRVLVCRPWRLGLCLGGAIQCCTCFIAIVMELYGSSSHYHLVLLDHDPNIHGFEKDWKHGETAYPLDAYGHGWEGDGEELQAAEDVLNDMAQRHGTSDSVKSMSNDSAACSSFFTKDGWAVIYHDDPLRLRNHKIIKIYG
uniref:Uncharacterized protein n=1 Tax=Ditylenchus dipsaci TaxID=166011 RepID=A0A915D1E1_9BILA